MKDKFIKWFCFFKGHDWVNVFALNNAETFGGIPRSSWGKHLCTRCGKEHDWQYDHY